MHDTDYQAVLEAIEHANHILLITHINPDADTLGSAVAFFDWLWRKQKRCTLFNSSATLPNHLQALSHTKGIINKVPNGVDLAVSFDCGSLDRLGIEINVPLINIDHHASNKRFGYLNIVDEEAISATKVVYDFFIATSQKISNIAAQSLYMGLLSDSKQFAIDRVDEAVFTMAARLVTLGAQPHEAHEALHQSFSLARMRLLGLMLNTLELVHDGRTAVCYATLDMFKQTGAAFADSEEVIERLLSMKVVQTVVVLRQESLEGIKGSLRAKNSIDVNALAQHFGGGGHIRASGFNMQGNLDDIKHNVLKKLEGLYT